MLDIDILSVFSRVCVCVFLGYSSFDLFIRSFYLCYVFPATTLNIEAAKKLSGTLFMT